jgi:hypothetical protein
LVSAAKTDEPISAKNPNTKIIVWTNNFNWCKLNFKFFNTAYIYFNDAAYEKILK